MSISSFVDIIRECDSATIKKIVIDFIISLVLCATVSCLVSFLITTISPTSYENQTVTITEPRIYVTIYGECYHSEDCTYLYHSKIPMGKQQAINNGYYACSQCGGISRGMIAVTYTQSVLNENDSLYKTILITITLSTLCKSILYLLVYIIIDLYHKKQFQSRSCKSSVCNRVAELSYWLRSSHSPIIRKASIRVNDDIHHKRFGSGAIKKIHKHNSQLFFNQQGINRRITKCLKKH